MDLSNSPILLDIRGVNVIMNSETHRTSDCVGNKQESRAEIMDDTYRNKLLSFFMNKLRVSISQVHIRFEHPYSSTVAVGACIDHIKLDTLENSRGSSCICKSLSLLSLSIYLDPKKRSSLLTSSSSDLSLLVGNVSFQADVYWNLLNVEDRWISVQSLQEQIKACAPIVDQDVLINYFSQDNCPLLNSTSLFHSPEEMRERISNEMQDKLSDEATAELVSNTLFESIKTPPPQIELAIQTSDATICVDYKHILYLSDLARSFPKVSKVSSAQPPPKKCTNFGYFLTFILYHIVSSSPLLYFTIFALFSIPFMFLDNFSYIISLLLCLFTVFLYGYRYFCDQTRFIIKRVDTDRSDRNVILSLSAKTSKVNVTIADMEPILSIYLDQACCDYKLQTLSSSLGGTIHSLQLMDTINRSFLLRPLDQETSPFISFSIDLQDVCNVDIYIGASFIQLYQPTVSTLLHLIPPSSKEPSPSSGKSMAVAISVKSDGISIQCIENDHQDFASVGFIAPTFSYKSSLKKTEFIIRSSLRLCDTLGSHIILSQSDQVTLFSFTSCPDSNALFKCTAPSLIVYLDLPFIRHFVNYIMDGDILHKEEKTPSEHSDYSSGPFYELSFPDACIHLPTIESLDPLCLTTSLLSVETAERTKLFNTVNISATALSLRDFQTDVLTTAMGLVSLRFTSGRKGIKICFAQTTMNLEEQSINHIVQAVYNFSGTPTRSDEPVITAVSDNDSTDEDDVATEITNTISVEVPQLYINILQKAQIELLGPNFTIQSSLSDRIVQASFNSLVCKELGSSDWSQYSSAIQISKLQCCVRNLDLRSKLDCTVDVSDSLVTVTPFLFSLPSIITSLLPVSDNSSNSPSFDCDDSSIDRATLFGCRDHHLSQV